MMRCYYIIAITALLFYVIYFYEHIILNYGSIVVISIIAIMAFQAYINKQRDNLSGNAYGSNLTDDEHDKLFELISLSFKIYIPICLPFFFFLIAWKKIVAVSILMFAAFITGPILFRIKYGDGTKKRLIKEREELKEQLKNESDGKWK